MRHNTALAFVCTIGFAGAVGAQGQEFARLLTNGEQATLSAFGSRPVDLAVGKLVDEFGVAINVEDPLYSYRDDVQFSHVAGSGKRVMVPQTALLEIALVLNHNGPLRDIGPVVDGLRDAANRQLPFAYRIDNDRDVFTLVPTRTRDEQGKFVEVDAHIGPPRHDSARNEKDFEHVNLLTESLQQQTGVRVSCCQAAVSGVLWGSTVVSFEARDEPARSVLHRLLRSEPGPDRFVRNQQGGAFHLVKSEPGREHWHWTMRCQPGAAWCFVNVAAIPEKP